jgi:hypothetical protein
MVAFYRTTLRDLSEVRTDLIVDALAARQVAGGFLSVRAQQAQAWAIEVEIFKKMGIALIGENPESASWTLLLEYPIPLRGKRIDAVLLSCHVVFVLEFKTGASRFELASQTQIAYYALDLFDFHEATRTRPVVPILVATDSLANGPPARPALLKSRKAYEAVHDVLCENGKELARSVLSLQTTIDAHLHEGTPRIDPDSWESSRFKPSPGILEAARELIAHHDVKEIQQAFGQRLSDATSALVDVVRDAKSNRKRVICFVSGVPGSGKTLVGLNTVLTDSLGLEGGQAVLLSGNRPLVRVLHEALVRDARESGRAPTKEAAERLVKTPVRGVLEFIQEYAHPDRGLVTATPHPVQRLIVFDEAQRAWSRRGMQRKQGIDRSEAAVLLDIAAGQEWGVVVALIGGGQEIHDDEAGLAAWGEALNISDSPWDIVASPSVMEGGVTTAGERILTSARNPARVVTDPRLELVGVSRSS